MVKKCEKGFIYKNGKCKFLGDLNNKDYPTHSFRNFDVGSGFKEAIKMCEKKPKDKGLCKSNVRGVYRYVESGRLTEMGDNIHNFISRLDPDEVEMFKEKFPDTVKVANEFGEVEDLKTW